MRVKQLDEKKDWKFGNSKANYIKDNQAVLQNVETRLKSFKGDWFLDGDVNIDWFTLLGNKDTEQQIIKEVTRVALETYGVVKINNIELIQHENRGANIIIDLDTIYNIKNELKVSV